MLPLGFDSPLQKKIKMDLPPLLNNVRTAILVREGFPYHDSGIKNENGGHNENLTMYVEMFAHCAEGFYLRNSALRTNPNPLLVRVIFFLFSFHSYAGNFMLLEDLWPMQW